MIEASALEGLNNYLTGPSKDMILCSVERQQAVRGNASDHSAIRAGPQ